VPALKKLVGNQIFIDAFADYLLQEGALTDLQVWSGRRAIDATRIDATLASRQECQLFRRLAR
jgi:hypothetical protein